MCKYDFPLTLGIIGKSCPIDNNEALKITMSSLFNKLSQENYLKTSFKKLVLENIDKYYKFRYQSRYNINNYDEFYHKIKTMMILAFYELITVRLRMR